MSFWDKNFNYRIIGVYGIKDKKENYLNLGDYHKGFKKGTNLLTVLCLLGLIFLGIGIYFFKGSTFKVSKNSFFAPIYSGTLRINPTLKTFSMCTRASFFNNFRKREINTSKLLPKK